MPGGAIAEAGEEIGGIGLRPSASRCEPARRRIVVERHEGCESPLSAAIDDRLIMVEHGKREVTRFGFDTRPFQTGSDSN